MSDLKWYDGGMERREAALGMIEDLVPKLNDTNERPLKELLVDFHKQLTDAGEAVPYTLKRLSLMSSKTMLNNHIKLSEENSAALAKIVSLNEILYGG